MRTLKDIKRYSKGLKMVNNTNFKEEVRHLITCNNFKRFTNRVKNGDEVKVIVETLDERKIECRYKELHDGNDLEILEAKYIMAKDKN